MSSTADDSKTGENLSSSGSESVSPQSDLVHFSIDAGLIDRLGLELVSRQETAVAELIKNGYDADATRVDVVFEDTTAPGGKITISDNGNGMTREELVQGFLRIATRSKVDKPISPIFGRRRAGRKGIGRFATQRLGHRLVLTTQSRGTDSALVLNIEWNLFAPNTDINSITLPLTTRRSEPGRHGTTLEIYDLREAWTDAQILRSYRHVQAILRPDPAVLMNLYQGMRFEAVEKEKDAFHVEFLWQGQSGDVQSADEMSMFLEHALAATDAYVDEQGVPRICFRSRRFAISEEIEFQNERATALGAGTKEILKDLAGRVRLYAWYFISQETPHLLKNRIQELLAERGGIRLYRNGFRVLPYGQADDDWLDLDASYNKRIVLPPHANRNFFGLITVADQEGSAFNETASREGLIATPHFEALVEFAQKALIATAIRVASLRGRKETSGKPRSADTVQRLRDYAESLRKASLEEQRNPEDKPYRENSESGAPPSATREIPSPPQLPEVLHAASLVELAADEVARIEKSYLDEISALRVLASLGLLVGEFSHEIRHLVLAVSTDLQELILSDRRWTFPGPVTEILTRAQRNFAALTEQAAYFDNAIADQAQRETRPIDLRMVLGDFGRLVRRRADSARIALELNPIGAAIITAPMHRAEWQSILFNLYTNAERAIRRREGAGRIRIACRREDTRIILRFSDDGIGIKPEIQHRIFDPFFTTTVGAEASAPGGIVVAGTGLGLHIVRQIVEGRNGSIRLLGSPTAGFRTTFEIVIPASRPAHQGVL